MFVKTDDCSFCVKLSKDCWHPQLLVLFCSANLGDELGRCTTLYFSFAVSTSEVTVGMRQLSQQP